MTVTNLKIELIHDVICSWCPIGYRNVKTALEQLEVPIDVEFRFLPYELNPEMPDEGESIETHLKRRNHWSTEEWLQYRERLVGIATRVGLNYDFSRRTHYWNSAKAHRLMHFAEKYDRQEQVNQALIQRYFTEGMKVDDTESLLDIADAAGIDRSAARAALTSSTITAEMEIKQARVRALNPQSVPTFTFDDTEIVSGSNSVEFFAEYFAKRLAKPAAWGDFQR